MPICPSCLQSYPEEMSKCPVDGADLIEGGAFDHVDKDLAAGDMVGEYRIEGKLGAGGFGAVYRAVHPLIGKVAAIKILAREFSANPHMVSRFISEARAVNQIRHKNIIDIFAFGQLPDGRQYYIMELLDGAPFDAYLAVHKRLTIAQALPILRGVVRALDAAHAKGILHRDLKPENIYLVFDEDGVVLPKLLDFGLAKLLGDTSGSSHRTKTGTPLGTPYYMSPEQCRGLGMDLRTDVYAFGAMVFEILVGEVPFKGESAMDIILKHMNQPPPRASERCSEVPPELDEPIARMLAKEPSERPESMIRAFELLVSAARAAGVLADGEIPTLPSGAHRFETSPTLADRRAPAKLAGRQTFLGAESDIAPARPGTGRLVAVAVAALALAVIAVVAGARRTTRLESTSDVHSATIAATAQSGAAANGAARPGEAADGQVEVRVDGAPEGAVVAIDGRELGPAPGPFKIVTGSLAKLTISAKGYKPRDVAITPTADVLVPISLEKIVEALPKPGSSGTASATAVSTAVKRSAAPTIHSDLEGFDTKK